MCVKYKIPKNTIKGKPLEFGNKEQIQWLQRVSAYFEGEPVCDLVSALYSFGDDDEDEEEDANDDYYINLKCVICEQRVVSKSYYSFDSAVDFLMYSGFSVKCQCGQEYIADYDEEGEECIYVKNRVKV